MSMKDNILKKLDEAAHRLQSNIEKREQLLKDVRELEKAIYADKSIIFVLKELLEQIEDDTTNNS